MTIQKERSVVRPPEVEPRIPEKTPRRGMRAMLAWLIVGLAILVAAVVAAIWLIGSGDGESTTAPPVVEGTLVDEASSADRALINSARTTGVASAQVELFDMPTGDAAVLESVSEARVPVAGSESSYVVLLEWLEQLRAEPQLIELPSGDAAGLEVPMAPTPTVPLVEMPTGDASGLEGLIP